MQSTVTRNYSEYPTSKRKEGRKEGKETDKEREMEGDRTGRKKKTVNGEKEREKKKKNLFLAVNKKDICVSYSNPSGLFFNSNRLLPNVNLMKFVLDSHVRSERNLKSCHGLKDKEVTKL